MTTSPLEHLLDEHRALLAHYGRAQLRCTQLVTAQAHAIAQMQAEIIRLRAQVVVRETALAWEREDRAALLAQLPGLPRRRVLARQVEGLAARIHDLARDVLHWQWRAGARPLSVPASSAPSGMEPAAAVPDGAARAAAVDRSDATAPRSVLCIAQDASGALVTQRMVESAEGLVTAQAAADAAIVAAEDGHAALEASLVAADLVICQTGCVGHNAYWRVEDHCRRTGKPCVLVDQPQVVHVLRGQHSAHVPHGVLLAEAAAPAGR